VSVVLFVVATGAALGSRPSVVSGPVAITTLESLPDATATRVVSPVLVSLEDKAKRARGVAALGYFGVRTSLSAGLPIYLVRDGETVRGFIAVDPRNGCELEFWNVFTRPNYPAMFHDVCHGSIYDLSGEKLGGPTPWTLDELVITVRDGVVYADAGVVRPGHLVAR